LNIRNQLTILTSHGAAFVVVGGQAGVLRQAIEFSHDLDILIERTEENAERVAAAVREIAHSDPDVALLLGRDFQQYIDEQSGTEIDVHLKLIAIPDYPTAVLNSSDVDFLGLKVPVLELPALYAAKRTDRPRDAVHRRAIEDRLRFLVARNLVEADEIVLSLCLDSELAERPDVATMLRDLAERTAQPLLQTRLIAAGVELPRLTANPSLHPTAEALLQLDDQTRGKLLTHPARFAAFLARVPLFLPAEGYRLRVKAHTEST
jgi:hypothetical protein